MHVNIPMNLVDNPIVSHPALASQLVMQWWAPALVQETKKQTLRLDAVHESFDESMSLPTIAMTPPENAWTHLLQRSWL